MASRTATSAPASSEVSVRPSLRVTADSGPTAEAAGIDAEHGERVDVERAAAEAALRAALGALIALGGLAAVGAVGGPLRELAREGRVRQAERTGCRGHAVDAGHGVDGRGVEGAAHAVGEEARLAERGRAVVRGLAAVLVEVELPPAAVGTWLGHRAGHGEVGADAVDRLEGLGLRVAHPGGQGVDDDDEGDRDGESRRDDDRLLLAADEFAPQIRPVHGSPSGGRWACRHRRR